MAKIPGGITSRPSGQLGNIIFGAARTPEGKVATAREAVDPSNPNTPAQQNQRSKFAQAVQVTQDLGPGIYQENWNRAIGQLPGFQSWVSMLLDNITDADLLEPPADRPLGNLHFPSTWSANTPPGAGAIEFSHDTGNGDNGTANDVAVVVAIEADLPASRDRDVAIVDPGPTRSNGTVQFSVGQDGTDYVVGLWFRGAGSAQGLISQAQFLTMTSGA